MKTKFNEPFSSRSILLCANRARARQDKRSSTALGTYRYDANGAMVKSVESGTTIEYVYRGHARSARRTLAPASSPTTFM